MVTVGLDPYLTFLIAIIGCGHVFVGCVIGEMIKTVVNPAQLQVNFECPALPPMTCKEVQSTERRVVTTLWDGNKVLCDTQTDGGGWLIIQRRVDGSVDFYRDWAEYKYGFGYLNHEFWFGNERIHRLTTKAPYELRINLKYNGADYYAKYSHFRVLGEPEKYKLEVSGYSGNAGDNLAPRHNGMYFSTKDKDNDERPSSSCAQMYHGAWWYTNCHDSNLNGLWGSKEFGKGLNWDDTTSGSDSATFTEMMIRPVDR